MLSCFSCAGFCLLLEYLLCIYRYQCASRGILSIFIFLGNIENFVVVFSWKNVGQSNWNVHVHFFFGNIKKMLKIGKMSNSYNIVTIFGKIWGVGYEFMV